MESPQRPTAPTEGWGWLTLLRAGLGVAIAAAAWSFRALASHPASSYVRPTALALAALPLLLGGVGLAPRLRASRRVAVASTALDAIAVLGTVALYSFDPRRYLVVLVLVVQAEGGVVLGLRAGVGAWALTGAAYGAIEALLTQSSGMPAGPIEVAVPAAVGLLLALGGGFLTGEVTGERRLRAAEREAELGRLAAAESRYRALVEQIPVVTYIDAVDRTSSAVYVSPQIEALLGYPPDRWITDPELWPRLLHPADRQAVLAEHLRTNATGEPFHQEYRMVAADGRVVWVRDDAVLLRGSDGQPLYWQGVLADSTSHKEADARVAYLADHDKLTGLPDRALFDQELSLALTRATRRGLAVGVLFVDLDRFKAINDRFGHHAGDEVLRAVAERIRGAARESDVVTRHGGDEFLVLVTDREPPRSGAGGAGVVVVLGSIAERIQANLIEPILLEGSQISVSASIGIGAFPLTAPDGPSLLRQADAAMYQAKQAGRGGYRVYADPG